jgi:hypothetical protein
MPIRRRLLLGIIASMAMPSAAAPNPLDANLGTLAGIHEGWRGPIGIVFFELLCPVCRDLYERTRAPVGEGRLRLQWIPVATLGPASLLAAARVLAAQDRRHALRRAWDPGATTPRAYRVLVRAGVLAVIANTTALRALTAGTVRTPSIATRASGGTLRLSAGLPASLLETPRSR